MPKISLVLFILVGLVLGLVAANKNSKPWRPKPKPKPQLEKPFGVFSSKVTADSVAHPLSKGVLLRTNWSLIEPNQGEFDWTDLDEQIAEIEANLGDKVEFHFSLSISAGLGGDVNNPAFPLWLLNPPNGDVGVETMPVNFRGTTSELPLMWDAYFQERLSILASELSNRFSNDNRLKLVYIPQATANGVEGHFNGTNTETLILNGFDEDLWVGAVKETALVFAAAFPNLPIAIEVHELLDSHEIPMRILNELYDDPIANRRIGAGMWWLSGGIAYQAELVEALKEFPGDIYAQVIGNSSQSDRFDDGSGDYSTVFSQAVELGIRYIEMWNYEFDHETQNVNIELFNEYTYEKYELGTEPEAPEFEIFIPEASD